MSSPSDVLSTKDFPRLNRTIYASPSLLQDYFVSWLWLFVVILRGGILKYSLEVVFKAFIATTLFLQGLPNSCSTFIDNILGEVLLTCSNEFVLAGLFLQVRVLVALHSLFREVEGQFRHFLARFCLEASSFIAEFSCVLVRNIITHILEVIASTASVEAFCFVFYRPHKLLHPSPHNKS